MQRWRRMTAAVAVGLAAMAVGLAGVLTLPTAGFAADDTPPQLVSVEITTPRVDVGNSYGEGDVTVSVHLRDAEGLPDTLQGYNDEQGGSLDIVAAGRDVKFPEMPFLEWIRLDRSSGSRQDGVWSGTAVVSPAWSGTYKVDSVTVDDDNNGQFPFPLTDGPTVTISGGERWTANIIRTPVRVVTGKETWRPRAQLRNTVTGAAVGAARIAIVSQFGDWTTQAFIGHGQPAPGTAADGTGLWTSPTAYGVSAYREERDLIYGKRGTRGYSMQGLACLDDFTLKLQASEEFAATTAGVGRPITVTGHVWPAPSIFGSGASVLLQRNVGGDTWQTIATAPPRDNGRYSISWTAPTAGAYSLRVRVPGTGTGTPCSGLQSIGSNLVAVPVTVR